MEKIVTLNMARKSYRLKNEFLQDRFKETKPMDFYRDIFPVGSFQKEKDYKKKACNGILNIVDGSKKSKTTRIIFDDLKELEKVQKEKFVITSLISYIGSQRIKANARWLYGITIDLDGVNLITLGELFHQIEKGYHLMPTYVVNSGNGLHLYYVFKKPIALYTHTHEKLKKFKYEIIRNIWNRYTSTDRNPQLLGIWQGFRVVGTQTKLGKQFLVRAFKTGEKIDIFDLNNYIHYDELKFQKSDLNYKSNLSLEEAKEKFPEWYEKRIVQGLKPNRWVVKRALYDWWLDKLKKEVQTGHRYSALTVLVSYAVKCNIHYEEVEKDCYDLIPILDEISREESNRFTERDVKDALKFYKESYVNFSRNEAERVSGITIPPNKRNGRKQEIHLMGARAIQEINDRVNRTTWRNKNGQPLKKDIVIEWRKNNPKGKKIECERETKLSRHTVLKWWNFYQEKNNTGKLFNEEKKVEYWDKATPENIYQPELFKEVEKKK